MKRSSTQSLWKQVLASQHGEAHGWCKQDEQVEQQVHCGSVQTSRYSEEPLRLFCPLLMDTAHLCFCLTWYLCSSPVQIPKESYETAADEDKQKLLEEQWKRCSSHQPWRSHERTGSTLGRKTNSRCSQLKGGGSTFSHHYRRPRWACSSPAPKPQAVDVQHLCLFAALHANNPLL